MTETKTFKDILVTDDINVMTLSNRHSHNLDYMLLCLDGSCILEWNGKVLTMTKHDLMFSPASRQLSFVESSKDFRYRIFAADSKTLGDILFTCLREEKGWISKLRFILENPIIRLSENKVSIIDSYRNLVHYYIVEEGFYKKRIAFMQAQAIIFELLSWVDEAMTDYDSTSDNSNSAKEFDWYWKFRHALFDNFTKEHSVSWYADKLQITPVYLNKVCRHSCNKSPQQIINEHLIKEAKRMLIMGKSSIKEVAYALSFSSESNFCKFFKRMMDMSPASFRKQELHH